jgi:hypothetical protein
MTHRHASIHTFGDDRPTTVTLFRRAAGRSRSSIEHMRGPVSLLVQG